MEKRSKLIAVFLGVFILFFFFNIYASQAAFFPLKDYNKIRNQTETLRDSAGFNPATTEKSVGEIMAIIIEGFLGFLAIIFIIIIIMSGYKYMNARGNEEKTAEATDAITRAIIGLLIVVSAYAITYFVFNAIDWWGGSGGGTGSGSTGGNI